MVLSLLTVGLAHGELDLYSDVLEDGQEHEAEDLSPEAIAKVLVMRLQSRAKGVDRVVSDGFVLLHDQASEVAEDREPELLHDAELHRLGVAELLRLVPLEVGSIVDVLAERAAVRRSDVALELCNVLVLDAVDWFHPELALEMLRVDDLALGCGVAFDYLRLLSESPGAENEEVDGLGRLLRIAILRELAQTIDQFDEDFLKELEVVAYSMLERLEALNDEVVLSILCSQREDVEDDLPARLDVLGFQEAELSRAHHDVLLDFLLARVQIVEHDRLEWLQEHLLVAEVLSLLLLEELVGELPQRIYGIDHNVEVLVLADHREVIA